MPKLRRPHGDDAVVRIANIGSTDGFDTQFEAKNLTKCSNELTKLKKAKNVS